MTKKKPLTPKKHTTRKKVATDKTSSLGKSILQGLEEAVAYRRDELDVAKKVKVHRYPPIPEAVDVKSIRKKLGLTQENLHSLGLR